MPDTFERLKAALADRYAIEHELGAGGMATVYLAEDLKHHRKVAVKVLRPDLAAALGPERFLREIEIAANLTHPHIVPLYDSGEAQGFLYYVMPYIQGESLRERLGREKQLPLDDALQIAREVADALGSAHSHDVVHVTSSRRTFCWKKAMPSWPILALRGRSVQPVARNSLRPASQWVRPPT